VDPCAEGPPRTTEVRSLLERFPSVAMILYTSLSPAALRATMDLSRHGAQQALLHRYDDTPAAFLAILERQPGFRLAHDFMAEIAVPLAQLTPSLQSGMEQMIRSPHRFLTVPDLAVASELSVRQVYRQLEDAGFAAPRTLLVGAKLLRAYSYMMEPGNSLVDIAAKVGFTQTQLRRATARFIGCTPQRVRARVTVSTFLPGVVAGFYPGATLRGTEHTSRAAARSAMAAQRKTAAATLRGDLLR
jgi:AraC-like DNA-binding protein